MIILTKKELMTVVMFAFLVHLAQVLADRISMPESKLKKLKIYLFYWPVCALITWALLMAYWNE